MQKGTATEPKVSNYSVSVSVSCAIPKEQFNIMYHLPGLGMDALNRGIALRGGNYHVVIKTFLRCFVFATKVLSFLILAD